MVYFTDVLDRSLPETSFYTALPVSSCHTSNTKSHREPLPSYILVSSYSPFIVANKSKARTVRATSRLHSITAKCMDHAGIFTLLPRHCTLWRDIQNKWDSRNAIWNGTFWRFTAFVFGGAVLKVIYVFDSCL